MKVIDLNQYRQEREAVEREALDMDASLAEFYQLNADLEDESSRPKKDPWPSIKVHMKKTLVKVRGFKNKTLCFC